MLVIEEAENLKGKTLARTAAQIIGKTADPVDLE
jgi:hypothetical protein